MPRPIPRVTPTFQGVFEFTLCLIMSYSDYEEDSEVEVEEEESPENQAIKDMVTYCKYG